ncbi:DEAD-box ATP-dependent RNA helicase 57 -like protein [Gossypium arboreum]|uniref:RNA helicase n=1 Tax=Gossypium arboreum TaxID=29729 RepID=A0A0B0P6N2_GOSAR|nr:DEAD-box ATP-dependent RNA helicase 57 -like protein [Gossypium arboreum]
MQRENVVNDFRAGKTWVLIATDVIARGMDFKGVNCVINYDFPDSAAAYIHRIGRSGRAGRTGEAITFYTEDDVPFLRNIANVMAASGCEVPSWIMALRKLRWKKHRPKRESILTIPDVAEE